MSSDDKKFEELINKIIETIESVYEQNPSENDATSMFNIILGNLGNTHVKYNSEYYKEDTIYKKLNDDDKIEKIKEKLSRYSHSTDIDADIDAATKYINLSLIHI